MTLTLEKEFCAVYARIVAVVGSDQVKWWLASYEQAFGRKDWEKFENLRAFPLFLRNENRLKRLNQPWLVDLALWEWTEFNTLYSPMNVEAELGSLKQGELLLNPTTQILRLESDLIAWFDEGVGATPPQDKLMALLYRVRSTDGQYQAKHSRAEWIDAALLDVLLENGRIEQNLLWREVQEHHGSSETPEWVSALDKLVESGIVLRG